jgi:Domain of unknown function (DUF4411)
MSAPRVLYVFDVMVWINLLKHYPEDLFGDIWGDLRSLVDDGLLRSPEEVRVELARGLNSPDKTLTREFPKLFIPQDNAFLRKVAEVRVACPKVQDPNSTKNSGDLHVLALAAIHGAAIVSNESRAKNPKQHQKIPDAADIIGVRCINWLEFLRERK